MAEKEETSESSNEVITIKILHGKNFAGAKGEPLGTVTIKAQFGEKSLGDIQKLDCTLTDVDLKYSVVINCQSDDASVLDEIAYRPVVLTFAKILPREKKKKEDEKIITLGQCTIDLLPIIEGEKSFEITQEVLPVSGSLWESLAVDYPKPEIDIAVSISQSLKDKAGLADFNILRMTVESVISPPDCLILQNHIYVAALGIPLTKEKENLAVFTGAFLRSPSEKDPVYKQKKWVNPGNAQEGSIYIPNSLIPDSAFDDEYGDFRSKDDKEYRKQSEQEKNRYTWNMERRCFLHPSAVKTFQNQITKQRYLPVEVFRSQLPSGNKSKKEEEGAVSYHGIAYVDASPLLYPGINTIRGAYKITPFSETALQEKTGCTVGISEEAAKVAMGIYMQSSQTAAQRKSKVERNDIKKTAKPGLDASSDFDLSNINTEGQQYVESKSYIMLELTLQQPLIPKRTLRELSESIASYIPPRPLFPKRVGGADRAVSDFHKQVECVSRMVLDQFRQQFKEELTSDEVPNPTIMEDRKRKLLYELNNSGKYFTYKERLKHAVVKIVREKYLKTSNFEDREELQNFLSQLYIFFMDQMHVALNKFLCLDDQPPVPEPLSDLVQLKDFAIEAESNGNIALATRYHEERISRDKNDASHWLDYGVFCLGQQDIDKAEECLKKCVAIDQENFNGLLLFAIVSSLKNLTELSETFFETVLMLAPKSIVAWTLFGLFHDALNNEIPAEMAFLKANQLNLTKFLAKDITEADIAIAVVSSQPTGLSQLNGPKTSDTSLTEVSPKPDVSIIEANEKNDKPIHSEMLTGNSQENVIIEGDLKGIPASEQSASTIPQSAIRSNSIHSQDKASTPKPKLERKPSRNQSLNHNLRAKQPDSLRPGTLLGDEKGTTPIEQAPVPEKSIFMVTIEWLLQMKAVVYAERALSHELLLNQNQQLQYYISLAQINILKKEFANAKKILEDSLQISYEQPDTWALLGHVNYFMGDAEGAQKCYERTLAFVNDATDMHSVYLRLASIYLQEKQFDKARKTFLLACQSNPSSVSWLGVGIACYRMDNISEAEECLCEANILNNMDPEVWAYLSLVCLKKQRKYEAEQSFKYALKLGFQDKEVIKELEEMQQKLGFGNPSFIA